MQPKNAPPRTNPVTCRRLCCLLLVMLTLGGCGAAAGGGAPPTTAPTAVSMTASPSPRVRTPVPEPCAAGRLTVGDLPAIDIAWADGVAAAGERARATWQADARPVWLEVGCRPLESVFRWRVVFFSDTAQAYFYADTGQSEPAEVDPASVATLPVDRLNFRRLYLALARGGMADEATLSPTSGISVHLNSPTTPFGPPGMAEDLVYFVAIDIDEPGGSMRDLFVSGADWTIHTYEG
jgi:hypothetical protein